MPFDLSTAKPVSKGFDLATAKPVSDGPDDAAQAHAYIENARKARGDAAFKSGRAAVDDAIGGAAMGVSDIGNTALNVATYLPGKLLPELEQWNRTRNADFAAITEQNKGSSAFKMARTGSNILATLPVGGVASAGVKAAAPLLVRAGASAPVVNALANAAASGGFRTGMPAAATLGGKATDLGIRAAGGAITGGATVGMVNQDDAGAGAAVGGLLPVALGVAGPVGSYLGRAAGSIIRPFTENGQREIAGNVLRKFGQGGPMAIDTAQLVPGSFPTLAEATGNAGLAGLQRSARDLRPNAFVEREGLNAAARNTAFDGVAGDAAQLDFYKADRAMVGNKLYEAALGRTPEPMTPYLKGQVTQLLKRPSIDEASRVAQRWAIERGEKPSLDGSLRALHDVKTAIDDKIASSVQSGQGGEVKALQGTQNKLLDVMQKLSPEYGEARATYAAMSQPVNAMEALQSLKLTDARGNMTLAKVQSAITGLERARAAPGVNSAKAVTDEQLKTLTAIRDDLLRQDKLGGGKSVGSNTYQNLATDNILSTLMPGKLGGMVNGRVGDVMGQVGKLAYSGPNEKIRNAIVDMMLDPSAAQSALTRRPAGAGQRGFNALRDLIAPSAYRSAPVLSTSR